MKILNINYLIISAIIIRSIFSSEMMAAITFDKYPLNRQFMIVRKELQFLADMKSKQNKDRLKQIMKIIKKLTNTLASNEKGKHPFKWNLM